MYYLNSVTRSRIVDVRILNEKNIEFFSLNFFPETRECCKCQKNEGKGHNFFLRRQVLVER